MTNTLSNPHGLDIDSMVRDARAIMSLVEPGADLRSMITAMCGAESAERAMKTYEIAGGMILAR